MRDVIQVNEKTGQLVSKKDLIRNRSHHALAYVTFNKTKNIQVENQAVKKVTRNIDLVFAAGSKCEESMPTVEYYDVNRDSWTDHRSFM